MRIETPRESDRFGAVTLHGLQKIFELDSGLRKDASPNEHQFSIQQVPYETIHEISSKMAIVIPIKNERLRLLEGILASVPHNCLPIVVSNSSETPVNRYLLESRLIEKYSRFTKRNVVHVYQKSPVLAKAFNVSGFDQILDKQGLIRSGKAEGMMLAMVIAQLAGRKYIGFVDADNFFPGAVFEYIRIFCGGFALSNSRYSMSRILWHSKPKIRRSALEFKRWGRSSVICNHFLNRLIGYHTGFETDVIKTGNAGEHAITTDLAMLLNFAPGYAIEPYQLVNMLERFGGVLSSTETKVLREGIEIFQIESRNPHLHASKGEEHIENMILDSLRTIYHSKLCPAEVRDEIRIELKRLRVLKTGASIKQHLRYPPLKSLKFTAFAKTISSHPLAQQLDFHAPNRRPLRLKLAKSQA